VCVLLPRAAPHVMDARGACPHCREVLAEWNRRTNKLVVHTWAGFADANARPERVPLAARPVASGEVCEDAEPREEERCDGWDECGCVAAD
jgi:hypothetical protein